MIKGAIDGLKLAAIEARAAISGPARRGRMEQLCQQGRAPMMVLFYHRVADEYPNDWTISNAAFERHVHYCRDHFDLVPLDEVQRRVREGDCRKPTVTFTFDDGYADNCRHALPLLIRYQIPCVYFVAVQHLRNGRPFPHDVRNGQELAVNSIEQLRRAADGGIEIGLHTHSHVDFAIHADAETIRREVTDAKGELEDLIDRPVRYFAFPYGLPQQLRPEVIAAVRDAGLLGFCSAFGAYNHAGGDPFHIRRIHGDPQFTRLKNWLSYDERKVRREPVISYDHSMSNTPPAREEQHVM